MKTIRAAQVTEHTSSTYIEYKVGKTTYWAQGEFYYNRKKDRMEHIHLGPKGGQYLVIFDY